MKNLIIILCNHIDTNPVVRLYFNSLKENFKIGVISLGQTASNLEEAEFIEIVPPFQNKSYKKKDEGDALKQAQKNTISVIGKIIKTLKFICGIVRKNAIAFVRLKKCGIPCKIVCVDGDSLPCALLAKLLYGISYNYYLYEIWPNQDSVSFTSNYLRRWIEFLGCKHADKIVSPDDAISILVSRRYNINGKKFVTVPAIAAVSFNQSILDKTSYPVKFIYQGLYTSGRDLDKLVSVCKNVPNLELYMRGYGDYEENLRIMANGSSNIFFLDPVPPERTIDDLWRFDVGITMVSSKTLNHRFAVGLKTYENLISGLALVVPNSHPLRRFSKRENCAIVYKAGSQQSLEKAIFALLELSLLMVQKERSRSVAAKYNAGISRDAALKSVCD